MTIRKAIDLLVRGGWWSAATAAALTWYAKMYASNRQPDRAGGGVKTSGKNVTSQVLIFEIMPAPPAIASQYGFKSTSRSTSPVAFVLWKGTADAGRQLYAGKTVP